LHPQLNSILPVSDSSIHDNEIFTAIKDGFFSFDKHYKDETSKLLHYSNSWQHNSSSSKPVSFTAHQEQGPTQISVLYDQAW